MHRLSMCALAFGGMAVASGAASLNMDYSMAPDASLWLYTMTLSVDTSSSAWSPGMGWTLVVFGDEQSASSPLSDFTVTSGFPVGPWDSLASSSGFHNGPTLGFSGGILTYWVPTSQSDTITWQGTSAFDATPGSLLFSELIVEGGATQDSFKTMTPVPEPASLLVLGGLIPVVIRRRRRS